MFGRRITFFIPLMLLIFIPFTASAQSIDVKLESFGATADDGKDDAPALQAALNAVAKSGGGRIVFPPGQIDILSPVACDFLNQTASVTFTGRGTRVRIAVGADQDGLRLTNAGSLLVEKLTFLGAHDPFIDARFAILIIACPNAVVRDCDFYGLAAAAAVLSSFGGSLQVEDSSFRGCFGSSVLHNEDWSGVTVRRVDFIDYGVLNGVYYSKSPAFPGAWIYSGVPKQPFSPGVQRRIVIEDVRLDEGAARGVMVDGGAQFVSLKGVVCNVNSSDNGLGLWLNGVRRAKVEQSWFGYTERDRPGIQITDSDIVELESVKFDRGVSHIRVSGNTSWLILRYCDIPASTQYPNGVRNESGARIEVITKRAG